MLSSNMKNDHQTHFHKKVTSKGRGKYQAFYAFTHTRLFSMASYFFVWNLFAIFQKGLHSLYNSAWLNTHFEFFKVIFLGLSSTF